MASITQSRFLFFTTSPRTPLKMVPEIELLGDKFSGQQWNTVTQENFMRELLEKDFFEGTGAKDLSFAARDRITRAPKALGFVDLTPSIRLTAAGKAIIKASQKSEVFLRQLLKFQLPSPYHSENKKGGNIFFVKPYLEMFRLINHFGSLSFDEMMMFGLQLTDYTKFGDVVNQIERFRIEKSKTRKNYKQFQGEYLAKIVLKLFEADIREGKTKLRESNDKSVQNFVKTKSGTMRDYTDACFRYLRATEMVNISQRGKSLSIIPEKQQEIEYLLNTIDRKPIFIDDEKAYQEYLFNPMVPVLYSDDKENIIKLILKYAIHDQNQLASMTILELKEILYKLRSKRKEEYVYEQIKSIKDYKQYNDIVDTFRDIEDKNLYDIPLMLEWNVWRAMTMLDGGNIKANLNFDDNGDPISTAAGNMADIICDYEDFGVTVEVTMSSGARQYEMEGEPVTRHLAKYKKETNKPAYCFFIAPKINEACISHFYTLHHLDIDFYGGKSTIIPIELKVFEKMVADSYKASYIPNPKQVEALFKCSERIAKTAKNEKDWYSQVTEKALNWLAVNE